VENGDSCNIHTLFAFINLSLSKCIQFTLHDFLQVVTWLFMLIICGGLISQEIFHVEDICPIPMCSYTQYFPRSWERITKATSFSSWFPPAGDGADERVWLCGEILCKFKALHAFSHNKWDGHKGMRKSRSSKIEVSAWCGGRWKNGEHEKNIVIFLFWSIFPTASYSYVAHSTKLYGS
jgi:hypothetical protein